MTETFRIWPGEYMVSGISTEHHSQDNSSGTTHLLFFEYQSNLDAMTITGICYFRECGKLVELICFVQWIPARGPV